LNRTLMVRQTRNAASENTAGRTWAAVRRREPGHALFQPDQQRPALAERKTIAGPVR
jgi:hypothetical protein